MDFTNVEALLKQAELRLRSGCAAHEIHDFYGVLWGMQPVLRALQGDQRKNNERQRAEELWLRATNVAALRNCDDWATVAGVYELRLNCVQQVVMQNQVLLAALIFNHAVAALQLKRYPLAVSLARKANKACMAFRSHWDYRTRLLIAFLVPEERPGATTAAEAMLQEPAFAAIAKFVLGQKSRWAPSPTFGRQHLYLRKE